MLDNITVAGPDTRTEVSANEDSTIATILQEQGINYANASVMIDGVTMAGDALSKTLKEAGVIAGSTIAVCVKLQNAA